MTVYARSDIMSVSLSRAHGGCGATHTRPVTHGAPVKLWGLDCHACENHLRSDPAWSAMTSEIPETPDEVQARENLEKRGALDRDNNLMDALLKLAQSNEGIQQLLAASALQQQGLLPTAIEESTNCPSGHTNKPGAKFCTECGSNMSKPEPAVVDAEVLNSKTLKELKELASNKGLSENGTKAQLIARLSK